MYMCKCMVVSNMFELFAIVHIVNQFIVRNISAWSVFYCNYINYLFTFTHAWCLVLQSKQFTHHLAHTVGAQQNTTCAGRSNRFAFNSWQLAAGTPKKHQPTTATITRLLHHTCMNSSQEWQRKIKHPGKKNTRKKKDLNNKQERNK